MRWAAVCLIVIMAASARVTAAPPRQDTRLAYGTTVSGRLTEARPEESWQFGGQAGDLILIDMRAEDLDALDTYLVLLDRFGTILASDDDDGERLNSRIGPFTLPDSGDYTIKAAGYSGEGRYALQVVDLRTVPAVAVGKPLGGSLSLDAPVDFFLLEPAPDRPAPLLRLEVDDDDRYSTPHLSVYGPGGYITGTEFSHAPLLDPFTPTPGTAYVVAVAYNPTGAEGVYRLSVTESDIRLMEPALAQSGTLDADTVAQYHYFRASAGDRVRLTVTATAGPLMLALEVMTSDLATVLFATEGLAAKEISTVLAIPHDDIFRVRVYDSNEAGTTGTYSILADWIGPAGE